MHQMTDRQREFWRELTAPFQRSAYETRVGKGGQSFTYLNSRVIENRLDDVCGPDGWETKATEGPRGTIVVLAITVPDENEGWHRVARSGGAGRREMPDENDVFKAGLTDAFKIAAAQFGIGRDLYQDGMPADCADLHNCQATGTPQGASGGSTGPPPPGPAEQRPSAPQRQNGSGKPPYDRAGTGAPFAWAKNASDRYQVDLVKKMTDYAKKWGVSWNMKEWDNLFLNECLDKAISWIKTLDSYDGEFGPAPEGLAVQHKLPLGEAAPATASTDSVAIKRSIIAVARSLLVKRNAGRNPGDGEIAAVIGEIGASVADGRGITGQVMASLKSCEDRPWMFRIRTRLEQLFNEEAMADHHNQPTEIETGVIDDDIPF